MVGAPRGRRPACRTALTAHPTGRPPTAVRPPTGPGPRPRHPAARVTAWVRRRLGRPWQVSGALLLTVLPFPGTHYSAAATWAYATGQARAEWGAPTGYALALVPLAWACTRAGRHGATVLRLCCIVIASGGVLGVLDPFDLVTAYTGVHH
ncbi:hypothetical protein ACPXCX_47090, partial [Streptomyces sp. DT225]